MTEVRDFGHQEEEQQEPPLGKTGEGTAIKLVWSKNNTFTNKSGKEQSEQSQKVFSVEANA